MPPSSPRALRLSLRALVGALMVGNLLNIVGLFLWRAQMVMLGALHWSLGKLGMGQS